MKKFMKFVVTLSFFFGVVAHASNTSEGVKKDVAAFKQEMTVKIQDLDVKITALKEQTKKETDEAKSKALTELEDSRDRFKKQVDSLEEGAQGNWKKMKNRLAYSFEKLNKKAQKLLKE